MLLLLLLMMMMIEMMIMMMMMCVYVYECSIAYMRSENRSAVFRLWLRVFYLMIYPASPSQTFLV